MLVTLDIGEIFESLYFAQIYPFVHNHQSLFEYAHLGWHDQGILLLLEDVLDLELEGRVPKVRENKGLNFVVLKLVV